MGTATLVPLDVYLKTSYRPDCDYVDGEVLERNMGETPHARLQKFLLLLFARHEDEWGVEALPEQRVQVGPTRFRIPDLMLAALPNLDDRIVRRPPLLCVEILSSEDRMSKIQERVDDYARMGVRVIWVIDPWRGTAFAAGGDGKLQPVTETLLVPGTPIQVMVAEIFLELERLELRAKE